MRHKYTVEYREANGNLVVGDEGNLQEIMSDICEIFSNECPLEVTIKRIEA